MCLRWYYGYDTLYCRTLQF